MPPICGANDTLESVAWSSCGELLGTWLRRPHVHRWWSETDYWLERIRTTPDENHAIITVSGSHVGYISWGKRVREPMLARCQRINRSFAQKELIFVSPAFFLTVESGEK